MRTGYVLLWICGVAAATPGLRLISKAPAPTSSFMICHVTMHCTSATNDGVIRTTNHHYECSMVENDIISDYSYPIDLPADFLELNINDLVAGKLFVQVPGGQIVDGSVHYPLQSQVAVRPPPESFAARHRRLTTASGTKTILFLRISTNDSTPSFYASQYTDYIFNTAQPDTAPSLSSQYYRMSFGKLNFVPTQYGVMEVSLNMNANGASSSSVRDAAISYVSSSYGVASLTQLADHVLFCIPPGTGSWTGTSSVNSWRMVMNNDWCAYLSGFMHEMGHNLGLLHSNMNNMQYMDFTSYMSAGYQTLYFPLKSFNGANNAQLGWFGDRTTYVDPANGGLVTLATFVDYDKSNKNNPVLIQVGSDVFLQYNRAKDFNAQAQQDIDQVTIVLQQNNGTSLLGAVDPSNSIRLTIPNFDGTGRTVVIQACSKGLGDSNSPDWMAVSVGYDRSFCTQAAQQASPIKSPVRQRIRSTAAPVQPPPGSATTSKPIKPPRRRKTSAPA